MAASDGAQSGKVMVITGGSRGIGAATARMAAAAGYAVCVNYRVDSVAASAVADDIIGGGGRAITVRADVADEDAVRHMFAVTDAELGAPTALVNNAGVIDVAARLDEMSLDRWRQMLDVNVIGVLLCCREAVLRMSTRHGGRGGAIVNVSSIASRLGSPGLYVDYAASKGAVDTLTIGLARELADEGIRVNVVRPGIVDTEIHASGGQPERAQAMAGAIPMGRPGAAHEIAAAIMWLASPDCSYTTGAVLDVSGGR
jgi:NAD(P)-dependent dehydrogenase (short-subunit alcohol dehydrogenase family)